MKLTSIIEPLLDAPKIHDNFCFLLIAGKLDAGFELTDVMRLSCRHVCRGSSPIDLVDQIPNSFRCCLVLNFKRIPKGVENSLI